MQRLSTSTTFIKFSGLLKRALPTAGHSCVLDSGYRCSQLLGAKDSR